MDCTSATTIAELKQIIHFCNANLVELKELLITKKLNNNIIAEFSIPDVFLDETLMTFDGIPIKVKEEPRM